MPKILEYIQPGVVTGNDVQKIFTIAKKNNFALPAVNCIGTDSINAALEAAAKVRAPIIIQFSILGASFIAGKGLKISNQEAAVLGAISGAEHVHRMAKYYNIPVILHTDHCSKKLLPWLDGLLDADEQYYNSFGKPLFSSHMIDLSAESIEENINISVKYLSRMEKLGITMEFELGCTGGEEDGLEYDRLNNSALYTQPEDIAYAYERLRNISSRFIIAAAFGNVHGVYKPGNVQLMPKILEISQKYISKKFKLPPNSLNLVFHGGSGSTEKEIKEAINYGVVKMNIDTDIQWATWQGILEYFQKNKNYLKTQLGNPDGTDKPNKKFYDPRVWIRSGQTSIILRLELAFNQLNAINIL
ncbi:class II fructose-bisphosphate aldolase [Sodalis sp. CWE]|uniref:class II fructose-bisphosphate aldolase n=1 Tax=Sodalis sp. CWE TaxID=2803816 RepID=UPI001C7E00CE|nr:class II fructose-bisphosphate aldolase [Sodalis sp. CWE]MBX4180894.1 class II fructose-bisphosphate aldolase [Sodalis sp. CWE]